MPKEFNAHTLEVLETLLLQTKLHMAEARKWGRTIELHDLHKQHAEIESVIHEIRMIQGGLR